jgi:hypothetical protein
MERMEFYHGYLYRIQYQKELSNSDYTQHHVYHIISDDYNYCHAHEAIESIMNDGSWRKGEWQMKNKQEPSMANAFHSYHEFSYDEDEDVYVYTLVIPYDD